MRTGQLVEQIYRGQHPPKLNRLQRQEVINFAAGFEECSYTQRDMEVMADDALVAAAYWAMADYAKGQM